jgi:hypothetical protein
LSEPLPPPVPIACSLSSVASRAQLDEWRALLATEAVETRRATPTELIIRLRDDQARLGDIVTLVRREKTCCPFFDFSLRIEPDAVSLLISVPDDGVPVLDAFAALGPENQQPIRP